MQSNLCSICYIIKEYFKKLEITLDDVENVLITLSNLNCQCMSTNKLKLFSIIFKYRNECTKYCENKLIDLIQLFLKYNVDTDLIEESSLIIFLINNSDNIVIIIEIIKITRVFHFYEKLIKICRSYKLNTLLQQIIKYLFDINNSNGITYEKLFPIFVYKYQLDDFPQLFFNLFENKLLDINNVDSDDIKDIFYHMINEDKTNTFDILLDQYRKNKYLIPYPHLIIQDFQISNYETDFVIISKIKLFMKYLLENNQTISDENITDICLTKYYDDDQTLDFLLEIKFYPLDLTILDNYNKRFSTYVKNYVKNIELIERNIFLEETLLCIPGGEYAVVLGEDFRNKLLYSLI